MNPVPGEACSPRVAALCASLDGMRQRVEGLRPAPDEASPYLGDEPFHRVWVAHAADPFPVRLARAQAAWRSAVQPQLVPGQLVLGTLPPRVAISYAGIRAWDFRLDREVAAGRPELAEVVRYWDAWLSARPAAALPEAARVPGFGECLGVSGIFSHSAQAYELAVEEGLDGLRRRAAEARPARPESAAWYEAVGIALDGASAYILAHARACDEASERSTAAQADEWRLLAANCRHIAGQAPQSFLQAIQLFYFLFLLNGHDSPGRIDQYLWPPLRRELAGGTTTPEAAQEVVDCLYLKLAEPVCYGSTLGGQLPEGGDATNPLTWLCLNSIRRLRLLSPRTALRWHRGTPEPLFRAAVHSLAAGVTFPTLVSDEAMLPSLRRRGVREEHARDYTFCGCGQTIVQGHSYGSHEDLILNAAKPLTLALHDGHDERTGARIGPQTGPVEALGSFEAVEAAVWAQLTHLLAAGIAAQTAWHRWAAEHACDFLRSALTHSCLERGRDWRAGGADYHEGMVDAVGLTTLADSLTAIQRLVFAERRLGLAELVDVLDRDWEGAEDLRHECLNAMPKFGNEDPEADAMCRRWLTRLNDWLLEQRTLFGGHWGMDIIGWSGAVTMGGTTGATPDGRRAGEPLADCAGPAQGRDRSGLTAVLNSMLTLPMREVHGPLALSLRVPRDLVVTPEGETKLGDLLRAYLEHGGQQVQPTVASAEEMRAARRNPEAYGSLIVRVGGFSAHFVDLDERFQEDLIRRTEHGW